MLGFGLNITVELKNKKKLIFDGSGFQEAICNFFEEWASVEISPKQLALASSVDELINLLANNVCDGDRMIFKSSNPMESDVIEDTFDAYDFIKMIKENVSDMDDICSVSIELKEYNEFCFYRKYTYNTESKRYTGIELGTPEGAEECIGYDDDQSILYFSDLSDCKIIKKEDVYSAADSDDAFYGFEGCIVKSF
jgi:hypothetical protein